MSACFKIVVSQPASPQMSNKQPGRVRPNASDSVCSATFIDLNKPVGNGSTVHLNMRMNAERHRRDDADLTSLN